MTVHFKKVDGFDRLPQDQAEQILYQCLLPECERKGIQLVPEGHSPDRESYESAKQARSTFVVEQVQKAFAAVEHIYRPGSEYHSVVKPLFETHPQGGYVGGGELMAAMMLRGYPAKFAEEGGIPGPRAQFPVEEKEGAAELAEIWRKQYIAELMKERKTSEPPTQRAQSVNLTETIPKREGDLELGALPTTSKNRCSEKHKTRLFVGEASFKGVASFLRKHQGGHPHLGKSIIATELSVIPLEEREARIAELRGQGVTIALGFDATKIHEYPLTKGKRFERIHWNCPHDGSNYCNQTLPPVIAQFFSSAKQVQRDGDRIHVTLAQPRDKWDKSSFYQAVVYHIRNAAGPNGYFLYAKRPFGGDRYPGYEHEQTSRIDSAAGASRLREFVFIKGVWPKDRAPSELSSDTFNGFGKREFYVRDTDNESSDCSRSNSPIPR